MAYLIAMSQPPHQSLVRGFEKRDIRVGEPANTTKIAFLPQSGFRGALEWSVISKA
jgi:hypothetical protein